MDNYPDIVLLDDDEAEAGNVISYPRRDPGRAPAADPLPDLPLCSASFFDGLDVPSRRFHDAKGLIPHEGVTLLFGDGGTGKSLLSLQLAVATVAGTQWLGMNVRRGPVLYFSCEDGREETHIRLHDIASRDGVSLADLDRLRIAFMAGKDCLLATHNGKGKIVPTPLFDAFSRAIEAEQPALVIIDNLIDVFAGSIIDPTQAKQFMHLLAGLSMRHDCPILLLAHPSMAGINSGSGDGGTRAWSNSARSRLYLNRVLTEADGRMIEDDPNARTLTRMKANYAATGDAIKLRWEGGVFLHQEAERLEPGDTMGAAMQAERVFLHLTRWHESKGVPVSPHRSVTYAPAVFASHPQNEGVSRKRFERAMTVLLENGAIRVEQHGPRSKMRSKIVVSGDIGRAEE